jgi:hypothetical protein
MELRHVAPRFKGPKAGSEVVGVLAEDRPPDVEKKRGRARE